MRVLIVGDNKAEAEKLVREAGFTIADTELDFVVSFGGDGTLMRAEFECPGIPKIVLKDSRICKFCSVFPNQEVLEKVRQGKYEAKELIKLEATAGDKTLTGVNDITVHNGDPRHGMRYKIWTDERPVGDVIIGDGVVVATPLGSTGYYRSITDSFFETGIGLAFNNSIEQSDHMVLADNRVIKLEIVRGPAALYADNQKDFLSLKEGDTVSIKKSAAIARWVVVK